MNVSSLKTVALSVLFAQLSLCAAFADSEVRADRSVWHSQRERAEDLKKVKPAMTDDEVLETYDAVGEKMININFIVESMRRDWLNDVFTAE